MIAQIWHRLRLMFAQGVGRVISHTRVQASVLDQETLSNLLRVEPYGFSYRPKPGCEVYAAFPVAGDRSVGLALICGDKRYQLTLEPGEVGLHDDQGQKMHIKRDRILVETPFFEVRAGRGKFHFTESYEFDVNGQGQRWDGQGVETWQDNDVPRPHHNHMPPEIT